MSMEADPLATNGRSTIWRRLVRGVCRVYASGDWAVYQPADWQDRIMHQEIEDRFHAKQGRSIVRWTLRAEGRTLTVYLKRHYELPWTLRLLGTLFPGGCWSPGASEFRHLRWGMANGLPVPRVVAAGEFIGPCGRLQSFLATEELTDMLPLHEAIPLAQGRLDRRQFTLWKRGVVREMARIAGRLHGLAHFHRDLYLCHFYVADPSLSPLPPRPGEMRLIDLHRLQKQSWTSLLGRVKDLSQLLYSSDVAGVSGRDRWRFWREYQARGFSQFGARALRWLIVLKAARYTRHNRRERATQGERAAA